MIYFKASLLFTSLIYHPQILHACGQGVYNSENVEVYLLTVYDSYNSLAN